MPKPEIDENGLSKGTKPNYIKPFQHLFKKKNFDKLLMHCEWCQDVKPEQQVVAEARAVNDEQA